MIEMDLMARNWLGDGAAVCLNLAPLHPSAFISFRLQCPRYKRKQTERQKMQDLLITGHTSPLFESSEF